MPHHNKSTEYTLPYLPKVIHELPFFLEFKGVNNFRSLLAQTPQMQLIVSTDGNERTLSNANIQTQTYKHTHTNTNIQMQTYKRKHTNASIQTQTYKRKHINANIQAQTYKCKQHTNENIQHNTVEHK